MRMEDALIMRQFKGFWSSVSGTGAEVTVFLPLYATPSCHTETVYCTHVSRLASGGLLMNLMATLTKNHRQGSLDSRSIWPHSLEAQVQDKGVDSAGSSRGYSLDSHLSHVCTRLLPHFPFF